jgi:hypothetical protein
MQGQLAASNDETYSQHVSKPRKRQPRVVLSRDQPTDILEAHPVRGTMHAATPARAHRSASAEPRRRDTHTGARGRRRRNSVSHVKECGDWLGCSPALRGFAGRRWASTGGPGQSVTASGNAPCVVRTLSFFFSQLFADVARG